jgi:hypothetical protein
MLAGSAPASIAVLIASTTMFVAPRDEPVLTGPRSHPGQHRRRFSVEIVTANGDNPRRSTFLPEIFVWPNETPCLALP